MRSTINTVIFEPKYLAISIYLNRVMEDSINQLLLNEIVFFNHSLRLFAFVIQFLLTLHSPSDWLVFGASLSSKIFISIIYISYKCNNLITVRMAITKEQRWTYYPWRGPRLLPLGEPRSYKQQKWPKYRLGDTAAATGRMVQRPLGQALGSSSA